MILCPQCQAHLNIPENFEGDHVRCPTCRQVFPRNQAGPLGITQTEPVGVSKRPVPTSLLASHDEADAIIGNRLEEREIINQKARKQTRLAGWVMLAACLVTSFNTVTNYFESHWIDLEVRGFVKQRLANEDAKPIVSTVCGILLFGPMLICVLLAGRHLLRLGARDTIVTGIFMNFLLIAILGGGVAFNVPAIADQQNPPPLSTTLLPIVMNVVACGFNLAAALLTIRALLYYEVRTVYWLRQQKRIPPRRA